MYSVSALWSSENKLLGGFALKDFVLPDYFWILPTLNP